MFVWDLSLGSTLTDQQLREGGLSSIVDKRNEIRAALRKANEALASGRVTGRQKDLLERSLNALGREDQANGVKLASGTVQRGAAAETGFDKPPITFDSSAGKTVASITVTFSSSTTVDAETVAHEGSHVADRQELVSAFASSFTSGNPNVDWLYLPENIKKRTTEERAYRTSAAVSQGLRRSISPGGVEIWNNGWSQADRSAKMQAGIKTLLTTSPLYKDKLNHRFIGAGFAFGKLGDIIRSGLLRLP